ncbi:MAG: DUF1559 domain-containing protein [Pirellulales bacterium]
MYNSVARRNTIQDGAGQTLMLTENLLAKNYVPDAVAVSEYLFGFMWITNTAINPAEPEKKVNGRKASWTTSGVTNISLLNSDSEATNNTARPSSFHPGGVNVVFADGSTRFLREDIDYQVYRTLMTSSGQSNGVSTLSPAESPTMNESDYVVQ